MTSARRILNEIRSGLGRAVSANEHLADATASSRTEGRLTDLCRRDPAIIRATVEELARMRAGWQHISYDKALGQLLDAMEKGGRDA